MGLIILPSQREQKKVYRVINVPKYRTTNVPTYFPFLMAAAMGLRDAKMNGCEEIVVDAPGLRPRRYTVQYVEECVKKIPALKKFNPNRKLSWVEKLLAKHNVRVNSLYV
jgi:hypothetical protein